MTSIRKEFYRKLGYIGLGIIPIIIFFENSGPERFFALAGFLICIINFVRIIIKIQLFVDDFFPPKTYDKKLATSFDKVVYYCAMVVFFCGLFSELFVIKRIDNTIDGLNMFWTSAFLGLGVAFVITLFLKYLKPSLYNESNRRLSIHMGLFIGLFLLFPSLACIINESGSDKHISNEKYIVASKGSSPTKNKEHYLYLNINGDKQRVTVSKDFWATVGEENEIQLKTLTGLLGYKYIIEFIK